MQNKLICTLLLFTLVFSSALALDDLALPDFTWQRSSTEHWRESAEGAKTEIGVHDLADMHCTICGSEVWAFEDGSADVSDYDSHGNLTRYTSFDSEGAILIENCYAYEYDEQGRLLSSREFSAGVLIGLVTYGVSEEGGQLPLTETAYYDDGTWAINEYDAQGNLIHAATYDAQGNVTIDSFSEYALSSQEEYYESKTTTCFPSGAAFCIEYNEYHDPVRKVNTDANGTVLLDSVYEYQYQDHVIRQMKTYSFGKLVLEVFRDKDGNLVKDNEYYDNGAWTSTEYNAYGNPISIIAYAADGSVEMAQSYEYEYTENLSWRFVRVYMDDQLFLQTEYAMDEYGQNYALHETLYHEDGSHTITTFNENEDVVSEITYAADGSMIE